MFETIDEEVAAETLEELVDDELSVDPNRLAYLEEAEKDLVLLLRRLGSSPLGPLMRRRRNFRTLEERYL